jgi:hypothetical protein
MTGKGCFGLAVVCRPKSETCKSCVSLTGCQKTAVGKLLAMQDDGVDVRDLLRWHNVKGKVLGSRKTATIIAKFEIDSANSIRSAGLRKKPKQLYESLLRNGIDLSAVIKNGVNPFITDSPEFMSVPVSMLLRDGAFTKAELKSELREAFPNWHDRTTEGQVSTIVGLLTGAGICKAEGKTLRLRT